jgi:hypothetical protein
VPPRVRGQASTGPITPTGLGGPDPSSLGKGSSAATCRHGGDCRASPATCPWQVGWARPNQKYGLPTDTRGRYADTTVSPPVSKAARRITVYCAQTVYSLLTTPHAWVMMACRE